MAKNYALLPDAVTMYTQTEVKDLSKNLVTGDFEKDYKGAEKCGTFRRRLNFAVLAFCVLLTAWLLMITVVREVQIGRLRQDVEQLNANMIAMSANVKSLNMKIAKMGQLHDIDEHGEVEIDESPYPDDDDMPLEDVHIGASHQDSSLEKLGDLTVLENVDDLDDDDDDDDTYEDDDLVESGDYYADYDRRRDKMDKSSTVVLKADYSGPTLYLSKSKEELSDLKRKLNENPEDPDIALTFPGATEQTPPAAAGKVPTDERHKRSVSQDTDGVRFSTVPRTLTKTEERRKTKKFMANEELTKAPHSISRIARNSDDEYGGRPFVAAHFHGNTSHLSPELHEYYKGNGLVRVSHGAAHDVWFPAPWTLSSPHPRPTLTRNGHVHVHHTGVYLVYVQIYYLDKHDIISWVLHRTNPDTEGRDTLLQCAQSSFTTEAVEKPNSCFSAAALFLKAGDRLAVRNTGGDRHSLMQSEKSFIGLIKLADAKAADDNEL